MSQAPVSKRHSTVCMICEETPYDTWNLYVDFAQIAISVDIAVNGSSLRKYFTGGGTRPDDECSVTFATGWNV